VEERGYKKLIVWQKADELTYQIYMETKTLVSKMNHDYRRQKRFEI